MWCVNGFDCFFVLCIWYQCICMWVCPLRIRPLLFVVCVSLLVCLFHRICLSGFRSQCLTPAFLFNVWALSLACSSPSTKSSVCTNVQRRRRTAAASFYVDAPPGRRHEPFLSFSVLSASSLDLENFLILWGQKFFSSSDLKKISSFAHLPTASKLM